MDGRFNNTPAIKSSAFLSEETRTINRTIIVTNQQGRKQNKAAI